MHILELQYGVSSWKQSFVTCLAMHVFFLTFHDHDSWVEMLEVQPSPSDVGSESCLVTRIQPCLSLAPCARGRYLCCEAIAAPIWPKCKSSYLSSGLRETFVVGLKLN